MFSTLVVALYLTTYQVSTNNYMLFLTTDEG